MTSRFIKSALLTLCFLNSHIYLCGQSETTIPVQITLLNDQNNHLHYVVDTVSYDFDVMKFYISKLELWQDSTVYFTETDSYHLIDLTEKNSHEIVINLPKNGTFNSIKFLLGIDRSTNMDGAQANDLDPMHGMYWTWQSGYINAKMEGFVRNSISQENFQFHLGGFLGNDYAAQKIDLPLKNREQIQINIDLRPLLSSLQESQARQIMRPCEEAVLLMKKMAKGFSTK